MIGWSNFAINRHKKGAGNSFFDISHEEVIQRVLDSWDKRYPGQGETELDRKVVVPINPSGFFVSFAPLVDDMPLRAKVVRRQPNEDPYIETYIETKDAERLGINPFPALFCNIVCYSAEALLENNGERSTDKEWEIVAVLASHKEKESMAPLVMARNFLEEVGGTKSVYTALEFAVAIYENSQSGVRIKDEN
jgi:hypothetical protein